MVGNESFLKRFVNKNKRHLFLVGVILLLLIFFSFMAPGFFSFNTFMNIIKQNASLAILSLGITFIIMLAGTDLSSGANIAFAGACGALAMQSLGGTTVLAVAVGFLVTILAGSLMGGVNGILIGNFSISPFMATLATMSLSRGLTLFLTDSRRVVVDSSVYNWFGQKDVITIIPGKISIPASIVLLLVLLLIMQFVLNKTTFGRKTYAVGGNPIASRASGINVKRHTAWVYILGGMFAGFAAIVTVGRAKSAQPLAGQNMEFDAITAVVLGGTSLAGGAGSLSGTLLGSFLVGTIFSGLGMMSISPYYSYIVKGALIIVAVYLDQYAKIGRSKKTTKVSESSKSSFKMESAKTIPSELKLSNITKIFPGVVALDKVNLTVKRGSVHALMGENGAGKSTLMKILSGVYSKDGGGILIDGKSAEIKSPMDSQELGISVIYQEFALVPELTITQNIFLGKENMQGKLFLNRSTMRKKARGLLKKVGLDINENTRVSDCTVGQQQMVEIAKAINSNAWVIVMDEPTSAITESEKDKLFAVIEEFKSQGMAIIYITHRMSEIFEIADEITVLRDGKYVMTASASEVTENDLIRSMVGREIEDAFTQEEQAEVGDVALEVRNLSRVGVFEPISFKVKKGEVLGFSGLMGAGRTEIARCIFGLDKADTGEIFINGEKVEINNTLDAIKSGIAYVSEDRRREGIVPLMSVRENITLASLPWISQAGCIDLKEEVVTAEHYIDTLGIKTPHMEQEIVKLSGGNQQKVCLARWLYRDPKVIILDEPTRGIDVGAKAEIHKLINTLCQQGIAVIMISSEMSEVLGSSSRIMVLHEGVLTEEFDDPANTTQEMIMEAASMEKAGEKVG